ncbi:hypothetical protein T458_01315 [Brevibacillus panacihumi W25]|uniref:Uncharacterized protein n=1 Tax=Brevibacillus panacihumi W25 TaxID=1408254 RepID=V6MDX3_9BACL|nr:hypothetical protein T458_01315 [Brevibacillus panacihumi W25]
MLYFYRRLEVRRFFLYDQRVGFDQILSTLRKHETTSDFRLKEYVLAIFWRE